MIAVGVGTAVIVLAMFRKHMPIDETSSVGFPLLMLAAASVRIESRLLYEIVGER